MSSNLSLFTALLLVTFSFGCSKEARQTQPVTTTTEQGSSTAAPAEEASKGGKALVRVVNAIPNLPEIEIYFDETKAFVGVGYKSVTPYKEVPADRLMFGVRLSGKQTDQALATITETLNGGRHFTVVAMADQDGKNALRVFSDDLAPRPSDKARVRVINANADVGEIDAVAKGSDETIFSKVNFMSAAGYREVEPGTGPLEIRGEGKKEVLATISHQDWEAGKTYTIILTGRAVVGGKIDAITIEDQLGTTNS
jgi:hypothetical protein